MAGTGRTSSPGRPTSVPEDSRSQRVPPFGIHVPTSMPWTFHSSATAAERSLDLDRGTVVKKNRQRIVTSLVTPEGAWFVKSCRIDGPRAWFRDFFRGPKARLEYERAIELTNRGIPVPIPVAWQGTRLPGESAIITRAVTDAMPLDRYLESRGDNGPARDRRRMAMALGRFLRQLAEAGVAHPDPHPGNFLVTRDANGEPTFTLLDLHAVRIGPPLSESELMAMLVPFNRWFQLRTTRSDRLRFLRAVGGGDSRQLEVETLKSNIGFWQRRFDRYSRTNREYRRIHGNGLHGMAMANVPEGVIQSLLEDPEAPFAQARPIKTSKSSTVIRVKFDALGECILKRIPVRSWLDPVKNVLRPSSLWRSWKNGHSLHDRGLPTPRPLLLLHRRRFGIETEGYLLTESIPDSMPLADWVQANPGRERVMRVAERLGRVIRSMHERGVAHRDLKASNILIDRQDRPWLIDLVGVSTSRRIGVRWRTRDLGRLAASFVSQPVITNSVRQRFLRIYDDRGWKSWWVGIRKRVREKVELNRRKGRVLG